MESLKQIIEALYKAYPDDENVKKAFSIINTQPGEAMTYQRLIEYSMAHWKNLNVHEEIHVMTLDAKLHLIGEHVISIGVVNSSIIAPREVFRDAIIDAASFIVLLHNHPSGDVTPSPSDISFTKNIVRCGKHLDLPIVEHIILAGVGTNYYSFQQHGLIKTKDILCLHSSHTVR